MDPIKTRFKQHFDDIEAIKKDRNPDYNKSVARHFTSMGHKGYQDMTISVLEFIRKPPHATCSIAIRRRVEANWIQTLRTLAPQGLNKEAPKPYTSSKRKK